MPKPTTRSRSFIGWTSPAGYSELAMDRRVVVYNAEYAANGKLLPVLVTYLNPDDVHVLQASADAAAAAPAQRRKPGTAFPMGKHNNAPSRANRFTRGGVK